MKHLKSFNEKKKYNPELGEFLFALSEEVKKDGYVILIGQGYPDKRIHDVKDYNYYWFNADDVYFEINQDGGTYMDFTLSKFSIESLREECNKYLDDDKSSWPADEEVKDNYDHLATTILVWLDKKNFGEIKRPDFGDMSIWKDICFELDVDKREEDTYKALIKLSKKYNITKK